jgi:hypothetical protein
MSRRDCVLVVEDDWVVARDFSRMLNRGGFDVPRVASSAAEALLFFDEVHPDMVLLDIGLKGPMDGIDLAAAIRATTTPAALAFVTGMTDVRTIERVKTLGHFSLIVKPVSEQQLSCAVELALHRFRTEQRLVAERMLAESDFRQLFDAAPDAMVVVDAGGRILLANAELERRFGYSADAIKGEIVEILIPEAARAEHVKHRDWFGGHPHNRRMGELMELSARRADGSILPVDVSLTPIGTGPNLRVLAIIRDTSERRLFQQAVSERRALAEQFDRALRLETVGRLAGGIAHDFNNLLMVIGGYTNALLSNASDPATERRLLQGIRTATDRAAELTRQLLAFGRRQVLQPVVVDPAAAVAAVQAMLTRVIGEDIQIVTTLGHSLRRVKVDPAQIEQVLLNLSLNARDAMPNGGILTLEVSNFEVTEPLPLPSSSVAVVPCGQYVMLAVRDNGLGMEQEIAARAFEPFFTTKAPGKGTGLGLSTVYGIVKQSGGFVWIESVLGSGTSAYVLLPATLETEVASETIPQDRVPPRGAGTVLLVEDEPEVRAMLVESLVEAGYDVVDRANGRDAIDAFHEAGGQVDLIVTDVIMPHSNGPALVRAARLHQPDVKALYMSGYADDQMVAEIEGDKHSGYLQKPFSLDVLLRRIAEMLASQPN